MAHIAFNVSVANASAAQLTAEAAAVRDEVARLVGDQFPTPGAVAATSAVAATTSLIATVTEFLANGGAAGNITATGITTANTLIKVQSVNDTTQAVADLTGEFTITATNTINNTGGTNTTGTHLVVIWR